MAVHDDDGRKFECHLCELQFNRFGAIKIHFKARHMPQGKDVLDCTYCGRKFLSQKAFNLHIKVVCTDLVHLSDRYSKQRFDKSFIFSFSKSTRELSQVTNVRIAIRSSTVGIECWFMHRVTLTKEHIRAKRVENRLRMIRISARICAYIPMSGVTSVTFVIRCWNPIPHSELIW